MISEDNGATWSDELELTGFNNTFWSFDSGTDTGSISYDGDDVATVFQSNGSTKYSKIIVTDLPQVAQLRVRIEVENNAPEEYWMLDDAILVGGKSTTWTSAWSDGIPDLYTKAVIAEDYDTTADGGDITTCGCEVATGKTLTVAAGDYLVVGSDIENNGTIVVENTASLVQYNGLATIAGAGSYQIKKTTPEYADYDYIYWSSPVDNETIGSVLSGSHPSYIFSLETANYLDLHSGYGHPQTTGTSDTFDDDADDWVHAPSGTMMTPGKGYIAMGEGSDFPLDFTNIEIDNTQAVVFDGGKVNNGIVTVPVSLDKYHIDGETGADTFHTNTNLIGNPYPSAIDVNAFYAANASILEGTFYFWTHDRAIESGGGPWAYNFTNDDYATASSDGLVFSPISGGTAGTPAPAFIASGQGFVASVLSTGTVTFSNPMRVTGDNNLFRNTQNTIDRLWLNLTHNESPLFRQILVGFHDAATDGFQNGQDGQRMENGNNTDFYSIIPNDDRHFAIQNLATFNETKTVNLGLEIIAAGSYIITIDHVEGEFATGQDIYLKDYQTNTLHNLSQDGKYVFSVSDVEIGEINNRFKLRFVDETAGIEEDMINSLVVYPNPSESIFNISWNKDSQASMLVYDLTGKQVKADGLQRATNNMQLDLTGYAKGVYFAKIKIDGQLVVKKLVLK